MMFYFAYGANLDQTAMAHRCPASRPLAPAQLARHRFFIMSSGFGSVCPDPQGVVHGLLWDLATSDVAALDAYEEVGVGLYDKASILVRTSVGDRKAVIYRGRDLTHGTPGLTYMAAVIAGAEACGLPAGYCAELRTWLPSGA